MSQENIESLQKRASAIHIVMELILVIGAIIFVAGIIGFIYLFFASPVRFNAVKGNLDWSITYKLTNGSSFFINIPFKALQPLDNHMISGKSALLTGLFSLIMKDSFLMYGIKQAADFLNSIAHDKTPYVIPNVKRIKKIAHSIIIYSVAVDTLSSILYSIFVTRILAFNLSNVHLSGVLIGGLILVIADLIKYGVFLQKEFDAKL